MQEIEIKFRVADKAALRRAAKSAGFREKTPSTFETNTLYDTHDRELRQQVKLLRLRKYGERCVLTYKARPEGDDSVGGHKRRIELESKIADCGSMAKILEALNYTPAFTYEKFRAEWSDGHGQLVIDDTPLGVLAELEGDPDWIDRSAHALGVKREQYMRESYGALFEQWKKETGSPARNMTFKEMGVAPPNT